jgi:hypothetical protein
MIAARLSALRTFYTQKTATSGYEKLAVELSWSDYRWFMRSSCKVLSCCTLIVWISRVYLVTLVIVSLEMITHDMIP